MERLQGRYDAMSKPVCLVMGAGAGIGGTVGWRFAAEGYHAVLCAAAMKLDYKHS